MESLARTVAHTQAHTWVTASEGVLLGGVALTLMPIECSGCVRRGLPASIMAEAPRAELLRLAWARVWPQRGVWAARGAGGGCASTEL